MIQSKLSITGTSHTLPFEKLSPHDFERLCLWLVEREGYERAEHLGAAGSEQGRDIVAWHGSEQWAFQCKRVQRFGPKDALVEVDKVLALPEGQRAVGLIFLVTCNVTANTRQQARERCGEEMKCDFWVGTELDEKVKRHNDILDEFFRPDKSRDTVRIVDDSDRYVAKLPQTIESFARTLKWPVEGKDLQEPRFDIIKVIESLKKLPKRSREFLKVIMQRAEGDSNEMSVLATEIDNATGLNRQEFHNQLAILEEHEFVYVWEDMGIDWITLGLVGMKWPILGELKKYCDLTDNVSLEDVIIDLEFNRLD